MPFLYIISVIYSLTMCEGGWDTGCVGRVGPIKDSLAPVLKAGHPGSCLSISISVYMFSDIYIFITVLRKFQSFIFFYESIYLGGGFKGSFFSSLSASML